MKRVKWIACNCNERAHNVSSFRINEAWPWRLPDNITRSSPFALPHPKWQLPWNDPKICSQVSIYCSYTQKHACIASYVQFQDFVLLPCVKRSLSIHLFGVKNQTQGRKKVARFVIARNCYCGFLRTKTFSFEYSVWVC